MKTPLRRVRAAFTLIEILVVLAVIGILAAILFPVFSSARESARTTTCASNLHQISLGFQLYLDNSNRRYPAVNLSKDRFNCSWADMMVPYTRSEKIFNCPSDPTDDTEFRSAECPGDSSLIEAAKFNGSYGLNTLPIAKIQGTPENRVRRPSSTLLVTDFDPTLYNVILPGPNTGEPRAYGTPADIATMGIPVPGWHREGANVLFVDGHVKWMNIEEMCDERLWIPDK